MHDRGGPARGRSVSIAGLKIFVLEDEPIIAFALEDLLVDGGASPCFATTLAQAEALIAERPLDAAILDVNVHGTTSYGIARSLRERGIPFIFATGYGASSHEPDLAGTPTVNKPYDLAAIEEALALAGRAA